MAEKRRISNTEQGTANDEGQRADKRRISNIEQGISNDERQIKDKHKISVLRPDAIGAMEDRRNKFKM